MLKHREFELEEVVRSYILEGKESFYIENVARDMRLSLGDACSLLLHYCDNNERINIKLELICPNCRSFRKFYERDKEANVDIGTIHFKNLLKDEKYKCFNSVECEKLIEVEPANLYLNFQICKEWVEAVKKIK